MGIIGKGIKLYLSGPMSNIPGWNVPAFQQASALLRAKGHHIVSAHEIQHNDDGHLGSIPWREYLQDDLKVLLACEGIVLLPKWQGSPGAQLEHHVAVALGYPVFHYAPATEPGMVPA